MLFNYRCLGNLLAGAAGRDHRHRKKHRKQQRDFAHYYSCLYLSAGSMNSAGMPLIIVLLL
ncbi:hypothetical protein B194_0899 [Serratia plymuthica A30]|nr:hypothetical protein B194_0899 [Serratia plymuthica A30]